MHKSQSVVSSLLSAMQEINNNPSVKLLETVGILVIAYVWCIINAFWLLLLESNDCNWEHLFYLLFIIIKETVLFQLIGNLNYLMASICWQLHVLDTPNT